MYLSGDVQREAELLLRRCSPSCATGCLWAGRVNQCRPEKAEAQASALLRLFGYLVNYWARYLATASSGFLMQLAMARGFCTSYPMNWLLIKLGTKTAM